MANIIDAQAVAFANQRARPTYDQFLRLYNTCKALNTLWSTQGMAALIPNDATALVIDGSGPTGDGRIQLTGADINNLITTMTTIIAWFEATGNQRLAIVAKGAVNGQGVI